MVTNIYVRQFICFFGVLWYKGYNLVNAENILPLNEWDLMNQNRSVHITKAKVPGTVHLSLLEEGLIKDPYFRFNEIAVNWIPKDTWIYSTHVTFPSPPTSSIILVFEGIDTIAKILVNGKEVGRTDNMFVQYEFDITSDISLYNTNIITVIIQPVLIEAEKRGKAYPYPVHSAIYYNIWAEPTYRHFVRKAGSDFGWDWGPALVPAGIWKRAYLKTIEASPVVEDYVPQQSHFDNGSILLQTTVYFKSSMKVRIKLAMALDSKNIAEELVTVDAGQSKHLLSSLLTKDEIKLWNPVGYGQPHRSNLSVLIDDVVKMSGKIGFRKVELIQDPIPNQIGNSFYFKINDIPIFIKGANWIPADTLHPRTTKDVIHNLLTSALDANMNMVRVWGGGVYERRRTAFRW